MRRWRDLSTNSETKMAEQNLWHEVEVEFSWLQSEAILYASRMSAERIELHRDQVVKALEGQGIKLEPYEGRFKISGYDSSKALSLSMLLEELTVLNKAADLKVAGFRDIVSLPEQCNLAWGRHVWEGDKVTAYDMITLEIPLLVNELRAADFHNRPLYARERSALDSLVALVAGKEKFMKNNAVILGNAYQP